MKKISQKEIDYILDNIDIVNLVSEYVRLEKRGNNYKGLCPFHNEKTPSFTVSPQKKIAHCFGCGNGGNIFQFLSKIENITYNQAIIKLGNRLGLNLEEEKKFSLDLANDEEKIYYGNTLIADYYNYILLNTKEAEKALNYLINRGLTKETIKTFNIGYAPNSNIAVEFFKSQNIDLELMIEAGNISKNIQTGEFYDTFKERIIFPIKDHKDRVVAFSGRTMSNDKNIAKYYNTNETSVFKKREVLYNFSDARQHIVKEQEIIICEGYMDVIKSYQNGVKNIVALMGTNIDDQKIKEILSIANKITLSLDNDEAGINSSLEIGSRFLKHSNNIYKLQFYNSKDIDEFLVNKSLDEDFDLKKYLTQNKKHFIEFKTEYFAYETKNNIDKKISSKNEILKDISFIQDASLKDILITNLSKKFNIEKNILLKELPKNIKFDNNNYKIKDISTFINLNYDKKICTLFKYFFKDRQIFLEFYNEIENIKFEPKIFNLLFNNLILYYNNYNNFQIHKFISVLTNQEVINLATYIDESSSLIINKKLNRELILDYIKYVKELQSVDKTVDKIKEELKDAISLSDYTKQLSILEYLKNYKK